MKLIAVAAAAAALAIAAPAAAADFSFTGNFTRDDNVQTFGFVVGADSNVTLRTWSYAGGTNAAGATIAQGGFDPILALFDSTGALLIQNDDGGCDFVAADAETGACYDTFLTQMLVAGSYTVAVMQYNNFAVGPNFMDGFSRDGDGNFTATFGCSEAQASFNDVTGGAGCGRDGHWAFDIENVESAVQGGVPEPSAWALMIGGFGFAGYALRRRRVAGRVEA